MEEDNKQAMRQMLAPLTTKAPASVVNAANVGIVRAWKALVVKAKKALGNDRATYKQLQSLFNQLSQYR